MLQVGRPIIITLVATEKLGVESHAQPPKQMDKLPRVFFPFDALPLFMLLASPCSKCLLYEINGMLDYAQSLLVSEWFETGCTPALSQRRAVLESGFIFV